MTGYQKEVINQHAKYLAFDTIFDFVKSSGKPISIKCSKPGRFMPPRWTVIFGGRSFKNSNVIEALTECFEYIISLKNENNNT